MPGIGCPVVISSTMWAKEVGYGASCCSWPAGGADDSAGAEVGAEARGAEVAAPGNVAVEPSGGVWPGEGVAGREAGVRPFVTVVGTDEGEGAVAR